MVLGDPAAFPLSADPVILFLFFFNDTATTEIYTLSLHDALPISTGRRTALANWIASPENPLPSRVLANRLWQRSEEHTSELQSQSNLVCRLLLEKKNHNGLGLRPLSPSWPR